MGADRLARVIEATSGMPEVPITSDPTNWPDEITSEAITSERVRARVGLPCSAVTPPCRAGAPPTKRGRSAWRARHAAPAGTKKRGGLVNRPASCSPYRQAGAPAHPCTVSLPFIGSRSSRSGSTCSSPGSTRSNENGSPPVRSPSQRASSSERQRFFHSYGGCQRRMSARSLARRVLPYDPHSLLHHRDLVLRPVDLG
jgi:hypothetical protein